MPEEVNYPQVTTDQVELWMANPVTKVFIQCLGWKVADTRDHAGSGMLVDSSSADTTHALIHRALGQQDAFKEAALAENLLEHYDMIFYPPDKDQETD